MSRPTPSRGGFMPRLRPKTLLFLAFAIATVYLLSASSSPGGYRVVPWHHAHQEPDEPERPGPQAPNEPEVEETHEQVEQQEKEKEVVNPKPEEPEKPQVTREQWEQNLRDEFAKEYEDAKSLQGNDAIYGNTLATLISKDIRPPHHASKLKEAPRKPTNFAMDNPNLFNPYPAYQSAEWRKEHRGRFIACQGASGELVGDMLVFKGHPHDFPAQSFGSYETLNIDGNLCFERETRLGPFGLNPVKRAGRPINWDMVNWGKLQDKCLSLNKERYDLEGSANPYVNTVYPELFRHQESQDGSEKPQDKATRDVVEEELADAQGAKAHEKRGIADIPPVEVAKKTSWDNETEHDHTGRSNDPVPQAEARTAILLRTYTGKTYTENDKHVMRSLITELALRSGGEYRVFLLLHVRDNNIDPFASAEAHQKVLHENVPREFHSITVLWNDLAMWKMYPALKDPNSRNVHSAQWLSVQKFSKDHPEFEYVWNWEMDTRFTGHHYDLLEKLQAFAKKQPRRGLWERNERYYIPSIHKHYDLEFREEVDRRTKGNQVWGAPELPFINPVGPEPPVSNPEEDNYEWGVGEDADLITVGPIFDPTETNWIIRDHIWGYSDAQHDKLSLPRRTTIVTQSRVSKRLLDIMHVENLRGNHIASEMTPQTVALLHSLKAVFAPHPIWFDRPWNGTFLDKWFNGGPRGESGGDGSAMGWGRERRYQGSTWYYRAEPPPRLYNNWMGYEDTGIGGPQWEEQHGRPCLPPMMLHPVKEVQETPRGYKSEYDLFYG